VAPIRAAACSSSKRRWWVSTRRSSRQQQERALQVPLEVRRHDALARSSPTSCRLCGQRRPRRKRRSSSLRALGLDTVVKRALFKAALFLREVFSIRKIRLRSEAASPRYDGAARLRRKFGAVQLGRSSPRPPISVRPRHRRRARQTGAREFFIPPSTP
jgi:hypothetical protein